MSLVPQFPTAIQPLMRTLIEEVIEIADRVRRKANQNQVLLARSIDLIRELIEEVSPQPGGRIYDEAGTLKIKLSGTGKAYIS
jgi:flagellar biosynthesis/type III secretory pathway chaperone